MKENLVEEGNWDKDILTATSRCTRIKAFKVHS